MDIVMCIHCQGSGKVVSIMDLTTGEAQYRQCGVCQGSGKVSIEKRHFSDYPDVSLREARGLMQIHGKPVEITITENEFIVLFKDKTRFVLGAFKVGYRGTGPDYAKRFLDEAGFNISKDDIAAMKPPVALVSGSDYIPPEELVITAPSLEEARQKAQESIPADAKLIALDVLFDGRQTTTVTGRGTTDELAIQNAMKWVSKGAVIEKQEIQAEYLTKHIYGRGDSEELADKDAKSRLPVGIPIKERRVLHSVTGGSEEVQQYSQESARQAALSAVRSRYPALLASDLQITKVERIQSEHIAGPIGKLLHITKDSPAIYRVTWKALFIVLIEYRMESGKVAKLTIRPQPSVRIRFQPTTRRKPATP